MNKLSESTKIAIITFTAAILGLCSQLLPLLDFKPVGTMSKVILVFRNLSETVQLSFLNSRLFDYYNWDSGGTTNFFNLIFYGLLLIGAILYVSRKQKETRLIRFFFSIVLIIHILWIFISLTTIFTVYHKYPGQRVVIWAVLGYQIYNLLWIYLSYWVIKKINASTPMDITKKEESNLPDSVFFNTASHGQRFFHLFMDSMLCFLMLSTFMQIVGGEYLEKVASFTSERTVIYFLFAIFRIIYYVFFEALFGATPAKFLTQTRVLNRSGETINLSLAVGRTASRLIPFEPFSFFGEQGWHDKLTETNVVHEKKYGIPGARYFLILPLFLILGLGGYWAHEKYDDYKSYVYRKNEYNAKTAETERALRHLSTNDIIKIKDIEKEYSSEAFYLKVEKIEGDMISTSFFYFEDGYKVNFPKFGKYYEQSKQNLLPVTFKKSDLFKAYTKDYDDYKGNKKSFANLLDDARKFEIESIHQLYAPILEDRGTGGSSYNSLSLEILNKGWVGYIVEMKNLKDTLKWENELPQRIEAVGDYETQFSFRASNYPYDTPYKVKIVVEDTLKRRQTYILEGVNLKRMLKRVE
jgi:uncharacterized RDD family membrane protein YckC